MVRHVIKFTSRFSYFSLVLHANLVIQIKSALPPITHNSNVNISPPDASDNS